jgi:hypothetical protein
MNHSYGGANRERKMRINARLDDDRTRKLQYLVSRTGANISEVIKQAIETYYQEVFSRKNKPGNLLHQSGFVGCADGDAGLSERYKEAFRQGVEVKHDHR